jgi:uncharacterized integral membrane protein (TIGR00697 family)
MTVTHPFKYYDIVGMLAIAVVLISNTVAQKIVPIGPFNLNAAIFLFPLAYLISDILTEVYGYARARRVTWMMFVCLTLMVIFYELSVMMPSASFWNDQVAFAKILGNVPRIVIASMAAILVGDFVNCYIMSKMKIATKGKHLWLRTIASTFFGQGMDSLVFFTIAFVGVLPFGELINALLSGWLVKTAYEILLTPLTYVVVAKLKQAEGIDHYDYGLNYTPFSLKIND